MFSLNDSMRYLLYSEPTDMRVNRNKNYSDFGKKNYSEIGNSLYSYFGNKNTVTVE